MATRSSGRAPKVKGCYECSQRRIDCDRVEPQCGKCVTKGLQCSGLGVRYRFRTDVTNQRRRNRRQKFQQDLQPQNTYEAVVSQNTSVLDPEPPNNVDIDGVVDAAHPHATDPSLYTQVPVLCMFDVGIQTGDGAVSNPEWLELTYSPATALQSLPLITNFMLQYFSDTIAAELVTIDDERNGWRSIVLPLAHEYDIIANAVQAAAAFHFSDNVSRHLTHPRDFYHRAIDGLRQNQELSAYDTRRKHVILISLLVLLAASMVNGSSDFRSIFRLLETAWDAGGGDEVLSQGELGLFVIRQYLKFRGYAAPTLSRSQGVEVLSHTAFKRPLDSRGWDDFWSYLPLYPEHQQTMSLICDLMEQACALYIERVALGCDMGPLTERVERLKTTMETFPTGSPFQHVLVWVCFFGAVESSTEEQHEYFVQKLALHHRRNGFTNITNAIKYLEERRSKQGTHQAWPEDLPTLPFFIV